MLESKYRDKVAKILIDIESVKFSFKKPFVLTSGHKSPVYVDCRKIISFKKERNIILNYAEQYFKQKKLNFEILAGGETAGIPYAAFLAERLQKKMIYVRKKSKGFGENQQIEGNFNKGEKAILIEDLATDGGSKVVFVKAMRKYHLKVSDIFVIFYYNIFDISQTPISSLNITMHSLCSWSNIINVLTKEETISKKDIDNLKKFLNDPKKWRELNE
jgi:orotate phosphoribosyltransferase